jgi:signal transduction histidine kinase
MGLPTLKDVFERHKEEIFQEVTDHIGRFPWSPYQQFLVHTEEGQRRLRTFVDLFSRALLGEQEAFLKDQERVGYSRALMEGFGPEVLTQFYSQVPEIIWNTLKKKMEEGGVDLPGLCEEIQELNSVMFQGYSTIMGSYLRVREERVNEKVNQLQELQGFTHEIITLFELEELVTFILHRMTSLFRVREGFFAVFRDRSIQGIYRHPAGREAPGVTELMEKTRREGQILFIAEAGDVCRNIDESRLKRIICAPVQARNRVYGVLCLRNQGEGFEFTSKEFEFLNQFLYIMAVALENALMLKEVEQAREALSLLTGKMITIQEEERRSLAADIHDTLTQALIGISYKIQFCKELPKRQPEILADQLDVLLRTVNQAIDQSRNLMSSLRPDLIDTMGLIPALERHVDGFSRETGIRVEVRFPKKLPLSSEVNICLFRVAQEALMNVYKHAETDAAEVDLRKENGNILFMVSDKGKGFVLSPNIPFAKDRNKLGLLSMKERIESIGGRVVIDAGTGRGCSIRVTIPKPAGQPYDGQDQGDDR